MAVTVNIGPKRFLGYYDKDGKPIFLNSLVVDADKPIDYLNLYMACFAEDDHTVILINTMGRVLELTKELASTLRVLE